MAEIGWASLGVIPTFDNFGRNLEQGTAKHMLAAGTSGGNTFGDAAGKSAGSRFGSVFKTAAKAALVGVAGLGALGVKFGADAVSAASDLEESTNKLEQVFGDATGRVTRFSGDAADSLGQSDLAARNAAATFGIFGKVAELSGRKNAKFSIQMTKLASDLASFHNTEPEQAVEALGAALRGESEPIRAFGVLLDEATLKAEALAMGLLEPVKDQAKIQSYQVKIIDLQKQYNEAIDEHGAKSLEALKVEANLGTAREQLRKATEGTIPALTQQQKVLAAQSAIFKQTEDAQGDFARTSEGLANQQRRLKARFEDTKAEIGTALLPVMTDLATFLNDKGVPALERFSTWFVEDGVPAVKDFAREIEPGVEMAKDLAKWLNDLPGEAKLAGVLALVGGVSAMKLRGGKGGALGSAGSALGLAKPVPVFVTNPGFAAGPGGKTPTPVPGGKPVPTWLKGAAGLTIAAGVGTVIDQFGGRGDPGSVQMPKITGGAVRFLRDAIGDTRELSDEIDTATEKHAILRGDLGRTIKLNFDLRPLHDASAEVRSLINLIQTANNLDVRKGGAAAVHRGKLFGDSYAGAPVTMNFNGVDLAGARREMSHIQRSEALGGADFRND